MDIVLLVHSFVRWAILLAAAIGIVKSLANLVQRSTPSAADRAIGSAFLGLYDLQVLLGLLIILLGGLSNAIHPVIMFFGVILGHVLQRMTKASSGSQANWLQLAFYIVPLLVILAGLASISHLPF